MFRQSRRLELYFLCRFSCREHNSTICWQEMPSFCLVAVRYININDHVMVIWIDHNVRMKTKLQRHHCFTVAAPIHSKPPFNPL